MDLKQYEQGAIEAKTTPPAALKAGYPTNGDPATGVQATVPGAYWYYQIQEELDNLLKKAGLTPDHNQLTQLYEGMNKIGTATGSLIIWPTATPPDGYLECDGSALSRTTYAALFAVLGTTYGKGAGTQADTTFRVPDLRGEFIRGWDHGRGADPDRAARTDRGDGTIGDQVGTKQIDQFRQHQHFSGLGTNNANKFHDYKNTTNLVSPRSTSRRIAVSSGGTGGQAVTSPEGATENRPRNIALIVAIKY